MTAADVGQGPGAAEAMAVRKQYLLRIDPSSGRRSRSGPPTSCAASTRRSSGSCARRCARRGPRRARPPKATDGDQAAERMSGRVRASMRRTSDRSKALCSRRRRDTRSEAWSRSPQASTAGRRHIPTWRTKRRGGGQLRARRRRRAGRWWTRCCRPANDARRRAAARRPGRDGRRGEAPRAADHHPLPHAQRREPLRALLAHACRRCIWGHRRRARQRLTGHAPLRGASP